MILITYNLRNNVDNVQKFIDSIQCSKKIYLYILDLRINKTEVPIQEKENVEVEVLKIALEDLSKTFELSYNLAANMGIKCFANIEENITFIHNLDVVLTDDFVQNDNISLCYADFELEVANSQKSVVPILYKGIPNQLQTPMLFIKTYQAGIFEEARKNNMSFLEFLSRAFVVRHVPEIVTHVSR